MKFQVKTVALAFAISGMCSPVFAGVKEAGGDNSIVFRCTSPAYVDSSVEVIGFGTEFTNDIDLRVLVGGQLVAQDQGMIGSGVSKYIGKTFDIEFSTASKIIAKKANPILNVGESDSLDCKFMDVQ